jgi:hypothetical protein
MRTALALVLLVVSTGGARAETVARFALVIGQNGPPRPELVTLRYADDDAVRWSVLLQTFGARVEVLSELDDESRRLYATVLPRMARPSRAELRAAMARLSTGMRAARAAGQRTVFYFVYAGHGDIDESGAGYITLADGPLSRAAFAREVLAVSPAATNHVIIDACRAFYFVYDRGPGGTRLAFAGGYFASGLASVYRNTGFLLATSSGAPSHEWEEFQAGIFSHEVRSALLGAADADGDARVSYRELSAFLEIANRPIRNERYRPAFAVHAPLDGDETLLELNDASGGQVSLPPEAQGRRILEDTLGVRWADLHPASGQAVTLRLPAPPWETARFFVRQPDGDEEYSVPAGQGVPAPHLSLEHSTVLRRGAAHEAFYQLFSLPFSLTDVTAIDVPAVATPAAAAPSEQLAGARRAIPWVAATAGTTALGAAVYLGIDAHRLSRQNVPGQERPGVNDRIDARNRWATISAVTGAALLAGGAGLWLHDRSSRAPAHLAWSAGIGPWPGGALAIVELRH